VCLVDETATACGQSNVPCLRTERCLPLLLRPSGDARRVAAERRRRHDYAVDHRFDPLVDHPTAEGPMLQEELRDVRPGLCAGTIPLKTLRGPRVVSRASAPLARPR
jgi:hypothetical protein